MPLCEARDKMERAGSVQKALFEYSDLRLPSSHSIFTRPIPNHILPLSRTSVGVDTVEQSEQMTLCDSHVITWLESYCSISFKVWAPWKFHMEAKNSTPRTFAVSYWPSLEEIKILFKLGNWRILKSVQSPVSCKPQCHNRSGCRWNCPGNYSWNCSWNNSRNSSRNGS